MMSSLLTKRKSMAKVQEPVILIEESCSSSDNNETEKTTIATINDLSIDNQNQHLFNPNLTSNDGEEIEENVQDCNLLHPLIDVQQRRKHSLPSLQITDGIMASQIRRLSDAGEEGKNSISQKDVAFLSTLSQHASANRDCRRHSIVTFSNIQASVFGENRRKSLSGGAMR